MSQKDVYDWIESGLIKPDRVDEALVVAGERASQAQWLRFLQRFLWMTGMLALALGVIFFFAFNWDEMTRQTKFMLIQGAIVLVVILFAVKAWGEWMRLAWYLSLALLIGAFLALFGQTYQTGADPWQLFATWALLISPLALIGRFEVFWMFWLVLVNLAIGLFFQVNLWRGSSTHLVLWSMIAVNAGLWAWMLWLRSAWTPAVMALSRDWAARFAVIGVLFYLTSLGVLAVLDDDSKSVVSLIVYAMSMAVVFWYHRHRTVDVLILALWCLGLMVVILFGLARGVFEAMDEGGLLFLALVLIGMSTLAVKWLKALHAEQADGGVM